MGDFALKHYILVLRSYADAPFQDPSLAIIADLGRAIRVPGWGWCSSKTLGVCLLLVL